MFKLLNDRIDEVYRLTYTNNKSSESALGKSYKCRIKQPNIEEVEDKGSFGVEVEITVEKRADIQKGDRLDIGSDKYYVNGVGIQNGIALDFKKIIAKKNG